MENLSWVFQKQERKKTHEEIEFHNSIQDSVFTTVYQLQKSAWKNACMLIIHKYVKIAKVKTKKMLT